MGKRTSRGHGFSLECGARSTPAPLPIPLSRRFVSRQHEIDLPLCPLSVLYVFAVDLHLKEVHRRVAENAERAQRVELGLRKIEAISRFFNKTVLFFQ